MGQPANPFLTSMVRLQIPAHMGTNVSIAGFSLHADDDGCVEVPKEHVPELKAHGLVEYAAMSADKADKAGKAKT